LVNVVIQRNLRFASHEHRRPSSQRDANIMQGMVHGGLGRKASRTGDARTADGIRSSAPPQYGRRPAGKKSRPVDDDRAALRE